MTTPQNIHRLNQAKRMLTEAGLEFAIKGFDGQIHGTLVTNQPVVAVAEVCKRTRGPAKFNWAPKTGYLDLLAAMIPGDILEWDVRDYLEDPSEQEIAEAAESLRSTVTARGGAIHGLRVLRSAVNGPMVRIQHLGGLR